MHTDGDGKKLRLLCLQVLSATLRSGGYIPPVLTSGSTGHPCYLGTKPFALVSQGAVAFGITLPIRDRTRAELVPRPDFMNCDQRACRLPIDLGDSGHIKA